MIIRNFEYLLALNRERHFARAAAACRVSQPTLSGGIKQLEEDMDVLIVRRGHRFEGFTAEGERVLAWAQQMMDDCSRLKQELQTLRTTAMQGPFRIGVLPATVALGSALSVPFAAQAPDLDLSIRTADAPQLLQSLRSGDLDVALTYVDDAVGEGLSTHLLYRERIFFFTASDTPGTATASLPPGKTARRIAWTDIAAHPLCLLRSGFPAAVSEHLGNAAKILYTDSPAVVAAHVRSGKWSTVLPQSLAGTLSPATQTARSQGSSTQATLRAIGIRKGPAEQANVGFVTAARAPLPAPIHALMELAHTPDMVAEIRSMLAAHEPYLAAN